MTTTVITGGTDGRGRALARTYLDRGDTVVIVGRDPAEAAALPEARFIPADLSLVAENRRVIDAARLDDLTRRLLRSREL
ncbi:hypothetical protein ABT034_08205 [Streptomyces sp. NPDC002773]|uniref:hypothetical protein n=1 Tax=Streptomyces sp. NPDC002773 TaxID=3154430 RepID=UPI00331AE40F